MRCPNITFTLIALSILLLVIPAGAQNAPRAAPANDNFANAKPITIGKDYTVANIHEATVEANQPPMGCGPGTAAFNSVWFTFTFPYVATISLSTIGSSFNYASGPSIDTKLSIYSGASLITLISAACSDPAALQAEMTFTAAANTTYYILIGTNAAPPMLAGSVLALRTRVTTYSYDLPNAGFEAPLAGADWKVSNATGDDRLCGNVTYPAHIGSCAFSFVGGPGENSRLKLSKPLSTDFVPRKGGVLTFYLYYRVQDAALGNAKIKYKVLYSDGTPASSLTINLNGTVPMVAYNFLGGTLVLASKAVSKVTHQVDFKSATGVLMIDEAKIYYYASPLVRGAVLPAPLPAAN